jgi:hypothetical protein
MKRSSFSILLAVQVRISLRRSGTWQNSLNTGALALQSPPAT